MAQASRPDSFRLTLPKELVIAAIRRPKLTTDHFRVEGWRNSWLIRVSELFLGEE